MYVVAPVAVTLVSCIGSVVTQGSVLTWYPSLTLPSWTPTGSVIGVVWTVIFILTAISLILAWTNARRTEARRVIAVVFAANFILNIAWSVLFFGTHDIGAAVLDALALVGSVIAVMMVVWPSSRLAAGLLVPYAAWASFATVLNYVIWTLN